MVSIKVQNPGFGKISKAAEKLITVLILILPFGTCTGSTNSVKDTLSIKNLEQTVKELSYSNPDSAIILSEKLIIQADSLSLIKYKISALSLQGMSRGRIGEYVKGIQNLIEATELAEDAGLKKQEADCLASTGLLYRSNNQIEKAFEYLLKAKLILQEIGSDEDMAFIDSSLGIIYATIKAYPKAIIHFDKAIKNGETRIKASSLVNKGYAYFHQFAQDSIKNVHLLDSAIRTSKIALSFATDSSKLTHLKPTALFTISTSYLSKKEYAKGLPYVDSLNTVAKSLHSLYYMTLGDVISAQLHTGLGNDSLAAHYMLKCEQGLKNVFNNDHLRWLYDELSDYYLEQSVPEKAKYYLRLYKQLTDSLSISQKSNSVEQAEQLEALLAVENKVGELENTVTSKNKLFIWSIVIGVICLSFMGILYVRSEKAKKIEQKKAEKFRKLVESGEFPISPIAIADDSKRKKSADDSPNKIKDDLIQSILTGLEELISSNKHIEQDFTLTKAADLLDTNRTYLSKIINSELNLSFSDFLNQARIKTALQLIESDENFKFYSSEAMAKSLGYKSRSTFRLAFAKVTGVTPAAYIRTLNKKV